MSLIIYLTICAGLGQASTLVGNPRPVTIEDVLRIEGVGAAEFSPDGRWLAYNLVPPYNQLKDYSYWLYARSLSGHRLWVKDLKNDGKALQQPGLDLTATNYLFGFSPDSERVVAIEHKLGRLRLVACVVGRPSCVRFEKMPDIRDLYPAPSAWNERLVWTSNHTFIMPTRDPDVPGSEMNSRGISGEFLWRQWNKAWRGTEPTATEVVSTGRDRSEDWASGELTEFDTVSGKTRIITEGRYAGIQLSPNGVTAVAARVGERIRPATNEQRSDAINFPIFDRRYQLRIIDLATGNARVVDSPFDIDPNSLTWSADGKRFAVYGWRKNEIPARGRFYIFQIGALSTPTNTPDGFTFANNRLMENLPWYIGPARAMLVGPGLVAFGKPDGQAANGWYLFGEIGGPRSLTNELHDVSGYPLYADSSGVAILAREGVFRLTDHGSQLILAKPFGYSVRNLAYEPNAVHSWVNEFRFNSPWNRNNFERYGAVILGATEGNGDHAVAFPDYQEPQQSIPTLQLGVLGSRLLAASRRAGAAVLTTKEGTAVRLLLVRRNRPPLELARINEHLNAVEAPQTLKVKFQLTDPNGRSAPRNTEPCLILPPNYQPGKRYPVLIDIYPTGAAGGCSTLKDAPQPSSTTKDLWAARGFIYIHPAFPLDFARTKDGPIAGVGHILDETIDALVEQGYADPQRIVLFGFSQGGVLSLYAATQSRKLAAVISMNSWADFLSHYFGDRGLMRYFHLGESGGDNRWRYDCVGEGADNSCPFGFGVSALAKPELYAKESPVALADRITAPVLLVHSDLDYFDVGQYDEMFNALYAAGKEARYVRYWGEGHSPSSPANIRDLWRRIDAFLKENGISPANPTAS